MTEYSAMVYKNNRNRTYMANCIVNNIVGFGKTEEAAISNLKSTLQNLTKSEVFIKPIHKFSLKEA